jgi:hypothetical protein
VALFTIEFELGAETRAMIERVAHTALMRLELGLSADARETIGSFVPKPSGVGEAIEGLVGKDAKQER